MHLKTTAAALTAGLAVAAAPALAARSSAGQGHGQATSPGQICKAQVLSHKKAAPGQKSLFAACVVGATRMQKQLRSGTTTTGTTTTDTTTTQTNTTLKSPAQICKARGYSHKKTNHGKGKSPFASCVSGAAKAQQDAQGSDDGDTTTQTTTTTTQGS